MIQLADGSLVNPSRVDRVKIEPIHDKSFVVMVCLGGEEWHTAAERSTRKQAEKAMSLLERQIDSGRVWRRKR